MFDFAGVPGDLAFFAAATAPSPVVQHMGPTGTPAIATPWLVSLAGVVPASGVLTLALPIQELGTPSATVLLDSAF